MPSREAQRKAEQAYYLKNREAILARRKAKRAANPAPQRGHEQKSYKKHAQKKVERTTAYHKAHPDKQHGYYLKSRFGMTLETYQSLLEAQGHVCAICGRQNRGKRLVVDHDHATGRIRGLLCTCCNLTLGRMNDDPQRLRAAAAYLEKSVAHPVSSAPTTAG